MTEGSQHARYVSKIKALAKELGATILENDSGPYGKAGFRFPEQTTGKGQRSWIADVYLEYKGRRFIIEVDGSVGHSSKHAYNEDVYRGDFMEYHYGVRTIRFTFKMVKDLTADRLREDLEHFSRQEAAIERYVARMAAL